MRNGYTTGTCAAAAAKAAALFLRDGIKPEHIQTLMPSGDYIEIPIDSYHMQDEISQATVIKDSGDDPDITNGARISVALKKSDEIKFLAGDGVGTVTLEGLQISPGEAAINPIPREMIMKNIAEICGDNFAITVSCENGEELAKKTFNPKLGIEGGISIIGTSGIVRPFSCEAIQQTIACCINLAVQNSSLPLILVPGNIGRVAITEHLQVDDEKSIIEVSNEWDFALNEIQKRGICNIIVAGHPGKLCKLADGHWDTHSSKSPSPIKYLENLFGANEISYKQNANTVEELFASISATERGGAGSIAATEICEAIFQKTKSKANAFLFNMQKELVGESRCQK